MLVRDVLWQAAAPSPPSPSTPSPSSGGGGGGGSGLDAGTIIGIVIGVVSAALTAVGVVLQWMYRSGHGLWSGKPHKLSHPQQRVPSNAQLHL